MGEIKFRARKPGAVEMKSFKVEYLDYFSQKCWFILEANDKKHAEEQAEAVLDYSDGWGNYIIKSIQEQEG